MKFGKNLFKMGNDHQKFLAALLAVYIVFQIQTPDFLAPLIDTIVGKVVVVAVALSLFAHSGPIVGVLGLVAAYELINRSSMNTGTYGLKHFVPTEEKKAAKMANMNDFPFTLEEEIVENTPSYVSDTNITRPSYKPVLCSTKDAAPLSQ